MSFSIAPRQSSRLARGDHHRFAASPSKPLNEAEDDRAVRPPFGQIVNRLNSR